MKKIAVLMHSLTVEYAVDVFDGIADFYKDKNVQLIVSQVRAPNSDVGVFEYQYWSGTSLLAAKDIDGIILITGSFSSFISSDDLAKEIDIFGKRPVVSVGIPLNSKYSYSTHVSCISTYTSVIEHLKNDHGCKKIGFFSANPTGSAEALERFEAYKQALRTNNLEYDEKLVLHAYFTEHSAKAVINEAYSSKEQIPFDAILCANDLTALGCQRALQKMGVRVPEDVKIIGFDETSHAANATPKISTISQGIFEQGQVAAELLYKKLNGKDIPKITEIPATIIYRQSCGCIPLSNQEDVFKNSKLKLCHSSDLPLSNVSKQNTFFENLEQLDTINTLFDLATSAQTLHSFSYTLKFLMESAKISSMLISLYDEPINMLREDSFKLPTSIKVNTFINNEKTIYEYDPGLTYNPHTKLFPGKYFDKSAGNYLSCPIFSGPNIYGYILCKLEGTNFSFYSIYIKIIINAIAQSYEYTKALKANELLNEENQQLQQHNSNLSMESKTDELTKILNRRGFMELGQKTIDIAIEMKTHGMLFYVDMDGLKKINDTYGHEAGDAAIKALSSVLTLSLRTNDIVARLSGDEFAAIAVGMKKEQVPKLRDKMDSIAEELKKQNNFDFDIRCSVGAVEFNKNQFILKDLLKQADQKLYIEKRAKHSR